MGAKGICGRGDSQIQKVEDTLPTSQPAPSTANIPQRRQLVRNSFCLSLSHFRRRRATFMDLNRHPSFSPPFFNATVLLFVSALSPFPGARVSGSRSNGIVCLCISTSIATTAAVKGNRTEVSVSAPFCAAFVLLPDLFFIMTLPS